MPKFIQLVLANLYHSLQNAIIYENETLYNYLEETKNVPSNNTPCANYTSYPPKC